MPIKQKSITIKVLDASLVYAEIGDIVCNSAAAITIMLPAPSKGLWYRISNVGEGLVTVDYTSTMTTLKQTEQCLCLADTSTAWFFSKGGADMTKAEIEEVLTGEITTHTHPGQEIPQATESTLGGIKAKAKTTETGEVVIDVETGKLYVPAAGEATNGLPAGGTAGQVLNKIDNTDYNAQWGDAPVMAFIGLSDVPQIYEGQVGKGLVVNMAENGLEYKDYFTTFSEGGNTVEGFETIDQIIPYVTTKWARYLGGYAGNYSIKSPHAYNSVYDITFTLNCPNAGKFSFWYKVTKEYNGVCYHTFKLDGANIISSANAIGWTFYEIDISAGVHTFFILASNTTNWYSDVYLDEVSIPAGRVYNQAIQEHTGIGSLMDNPDKIAKVNAEGTAIEFIDTSSIVLNGLAQATEIALGGIKAKAKTTETGEVAIDAETGKLYVPAAGATGETGETGADGVGVPVGGTAGQVLSKIDGTDYSTQWLSQKKSISFYIDDVLEADESTISIIAPQDMTIIEVRLVVDIAPTGAAIIIDLNKNGTTLYTTQDNRPTIAIDGTAATAIIPDIISIVLGDKITLDLDQVGSTVAGENLSVLIICEVV